MSLAVLCCSLRCRHVFWHAFISSVYLSEDCELHLHAFLMFTRAPVLLFAEVFQFHAKCMCVLALCYLLVNGYDYKSCMPVHSLTGTLRPHMDM